MLVSVAVRVYLSSPLLLACLFASCESHNNAGSDVGLLSNSQPFVRNKRSSNQFDKNALEDPGVIVGIIVGVVGVVVVIGVVILLCRLFCCKEASCTGCHCCKEEETYLDAGTVPIKIPSQDRPPGDNSPISTIANDHPPSHNKPSGDVEKASDTAPYLPRYDDVPHWDRRLNESMDKIQSLESPDFVARRPAENSEALSPNDRENAKGVSASGAKQKNKTPTRRKLTYEADNPDVSLSHSGNGEFIALEQEPKKRNVDAPRYGREFPSNSHNKPHRSRHFQPTREDDRTESTRMESDTEERTDGREFPLLEHEPRKRSLNVSHPDFSPREEAGDDERHFSPVDHAHQPPHYPDHRNPMWREESRRPGWNHREILNARAPIPHNRSYVPDHGQSVSFARDNLAFNQDSTETAV